MPYTKLTGLSVEFRKGITIAVSKRELARDLSSLTVFLGTGSEEWNVVTAKV